MVGEIEIQGIMDFLSTINIGLIPSEAVAIIITLIILLFIVKMDKNKGIMGFAPLSILMFGLGFNINIIYILIGTIAFTIYLFIGATYTIETTG